MRSNIRVIPVSPEAAAIQKYVSYPVSYCTGIPDITIPLYEIKVGDITLPISLTYHSSGLKPQEPSGCTGTGWTLNANPAVTRAIKGIPDEIDGKGFFYRPSNIYDQDFLRKVVIDGSHDIEPDLFFYKLTTKSGRCIPRSISGFSAFPSENISISRIQSDGKISITDENGIKYMFGDNTNNREITTCSGGNYITNWLCSTITSPLTGAKISFTYDAYPYSEADIGFSDAVIIEDCIEKVGGPSPTKTTIINGIIKTEEMQNDGSWKALSLGVPPFSYKKLYDPGNVTQRKISAILFDNGRIDFYMNGKNLSRMIVKDQSGNEIRRIDFFVSRYNSNTELTKLDSLKILASGCDSRTLIMEYNAVNNVPPKLTKAIDHWGFYNGYHTENVNQRSAVPSFKTIVTTTEQVLPSRRNIEQTISGAYRNPNFTYAQIGLLWKITDSQGSETTFTYHGNNTAIKGPKGWLWDAYLISVGGARIQSIEEKDTKTGDIYSRTFYYHYVEDINNPQDYNTYPDFGVAKCFIADDNYCFTQTKAQLDGAVADHTPWGIRPAAERSDTYSRVRSWGSMPLDDITIGGSPVMYNCVTELRRNKQSSESQVVKYYYYTPGVGANNAGWDGPYQPDQYNIYPTKKYTRDTSIPFGLDYMEDIMLGKLIREEYYKNGTELISKKEYKYERQYPGDGFSIQRPYQSQTFSIAFEVDKKYKNEKFNVKSWNILGGWVALTQETTTHISDGRTLMTEKRFEYNQTGHHYPIRQETTNSYSQTMIDIFKYTNDNIDIFPEKLNGDLNYYGVSNILLEHRHIIGNDTGYVRKKYTGIRPEYVKSKYRKGSVFDVEYTFHKYDHYGNPVDVSDKSGIHTCFLWGYNNQYMIAQIENATIAQVLTALGKNETWLQNMSERNIPLDSELQLINSLRGTLPNSQITTYTYKPLLGMSAVTMPDGTKNQFKMDNFGRLTETARIENNQPKVLQQYKYFTGGNIFGVQDPSNPNQYYSPINFTWAEKYESNIYTIGAAMTFKVKVEGGSNNLKYTWKLTNNQDVVLSQKETTTNTVQLTPQAVSTSVKQNRLYCRVKDQITKEEVEIVTWFYVK